MASKHRHLSGGSTGRAGSPVPDYFVDLTVDSPQQRHSHSCGRPSVLRLSRNAESSQAATIEVPDAETVSCSNRLLPPKKRPRRDKVVEINDSMTGEPTVLSCPICLEDLTSKCKPTTTRCGHIYCAECIEKTLNTSKKCPKCQSSITQKSCIRIYF